MNASRKLNVGPMPRQTENYDYAIETSYRWDRIISALFVLVLFVALIGWFYRFLTAPAPTFAGPQSTATAAQSVSSNTSTGKATGAKAVSATEVISSQNQQANETMASPVIEQEIAEDTTASFITHKPAKADQADSDAEQNLQMAATQSDSSANEAATKEPSKNREFKVSIPARRNPVIEIVDPSITQARLTHRVVKGVPEDRLGSLVKMSPEGIIKLFLFTEVNGLKGKTLYHEWYLKGKRLARVRLPINKQLKRTASSKFINLQMLGNWEVKVVDQDNREYVKAHFKVVK